MLTLSASDCCIRMKLLVSRPTLSRRGLLGSGSSKWPASVIEPLKVTSAKVFVQGQNLLSFDNIDAMDAENLNTGYPVLKSVNVGLAVQF